MTNTYKGLSIIFNADRLYGGDYMLGERSCAPAYLDWIYKGSRYRPYKMTVNSISSIGHFCESHVPRSHSESKDAYSKRMYKNTVDFYLNWIERSTETLMKKVSETEYVAK